MSKKSKVPTAIEDTTLARPPDRTPSTVGGAAPISEEVTQLQERPIAGAKDPIRLLLSFHHRVRLAFQTLTRLSRQSAGNIDVVEIEALYDFFSIELAAHDLDEEASLMPRLRQTKHPDRLDKLMAACTKQHERLETTVEACLPHLQAVAEKRIRPNPERLAEVREQLGQVLEPHLYLEEQEIFPLARLLLSVEQQESMFDEMQSRRRRREENKPSVLAIA